MKLKQTKRQPRGKRIGESSLALCDRTKPLTRAFSPRQLPTNHDPVGGPKARSTNIRLINRRECFLGCHSVCFAPPDVGEKKPKNSPCKVVPYQRHGVSPWGSPQGYKPSLTRRL